MLDYTVKPSTFMIQNISNVVKKIIYMILLLGKSVIDAMQDNQTWWCKIYDTFTRKRDKFLFSFKISDFSPLYPPIN